jgi:hypothetical protein
MKKYTSSNADAALAEALGAPTPSLPTPRESKPLIPAPIASNNQIATDADYARTNAIEIIQKGSEAVDMALNLATESQHPRAFEVLGQLLKIQSDNVDKLLKIHQDKQKLSGNVSSGQMTGNVYIDKAVFSGTTTQLLEMMRSTQKNQTTESDELDD